MGMIFFKAKMMKMHMKNSKKVFMKCESRGKKVLFLKLIYYFYDFKYIY